MTSSETTNPVASESTTSAETATTQASAGLAKWILPALLLGALVAGFVGERATYLTREHFYLLPTGFVHNAAEKKIQDMNMCMNRAMGLGAFGATLFGLSGLLLGLSRGPARGVVGCVIGIVVGAGVGCVIGPTGYYLGETLSRANFDSIIRSVMLFSPLWLVLCIALAVYAVCLLGPFKKLNRAILCGALAGLGGGVAYPILSGFLFPTSHPEMLIPDSQGGRIFGFMVGAVAAVLGVWGTYRR